MVIRKKKIIINGQEFTVDVFETKIKHGKEIEEGTINAILEEEKIEDAVKEAMQKIRDVRKKYEDIEKNLDYYHEVGKALQFIDKKGFSDRHGNKSGILKRMAADLGPELLFGKPVLKKEGTNPEAESKRLIEKMYQLGKFKKTDLPKANWWQWYEILKFKGLYNQRGTLKIIFDLCAKNVSYVQLREEIVKLRNIKSFS